MGVAFLDSAPGHVYNLAVGNVADWTLTPGLPNGDKYAASDGSIAAVFNQCGTAFDWRTGQWTLEFWLWIPTTPPSLGWMFTYAPANDGGFNFSFGCWVNASRTFAFNLYNTSGNASLGRTCSIAIPANAWNYMTIQKPGSGLNPDIYVDKVLRNGAAATSGSPTVPTATTRFYMWSGPDLSAPMPATARIGKPAMYNKLLTPLQMSKHYDAMTT